MSNQIFGRKLHLNTKLRRRLFRSLVSNFLLNQKLTTTLARAKAIQPFVEGLVNKAKDGKKNTNRYLMAEIPNKVVVDKLLELATHFKNRQGGYTKLLKLKNKNGDNSKQAVLVWSQMEKSKKLG